MIKYFIMRWGGAIAVGVGVHLAIKAPSIESMYALAAAVLCIWGVFLIVDAQEHKEKQEE